MVIYFSLERISKLTNILTTLSNDLVKAAYLLLRNWLRVKKTSYARQIM